MPHAPTLCRPFPSPVVLPPTPARTTLSIPCPLPLPSSPCIQNYSDCPCPTADLPLADLALPSPPPALPLPTPPRVRLHQVPLPPASLKRPPTLPPVRWHHRYRPRHPQPTTTANPSASPTTPLDPIDIEPPTRNPEPVTAGLLELDPSPPEKEVAGVDTSPKKKRCFDLLLFWLDLVLPWLMCYKSGGLSR